MYKGDLLPSNSQPILSKNVNLDLIVDDLAKSSREAPVFEASSQKVRFVFKGLID